MICHRCHGLMCPLELRDWAGGKVQDLSDALRCISCGEIVDQLIINNRTRARERETSSPKGGPRYNVQITTV